MGESVLTLESGLQSMSVQSCDSITLGGLRTMNMSMQSIDSINWRSTDWRTLSSDLRTLSSGLSSDLRTLSVQSSDCESIATVEYSPQSKKKLLLKAVKMFPSSNGPIFPMGVLPENSPQSRTQRLQNATLSVNEMNIPWNDSGSFTMDVTSMTSPKSDRFQKFPMGGGVPVNSSTTSKRFQNAISGTNKKSFDSETSFPMGVSTVISPKSERFQNAISGLNKTSFQSKDSSGVSVNSPKSNRFQNAISGSNDQTSLGPMLKRLPKVSRGGSIGWIPEDHHVMDIDKKSGEQIHLPEFLPLDCNSVTSRPVPQKDIDESNGNRAKTSSVIPNSNDVLFGQSKNLRDHPGNKRRGQLVAQYFNEYNHPETTKSRKTEITWRVVQALVNENRRFLKQLKKGKVTSIEDTEWVEFSDLAEVRCRVASLFRDYRARVNVLAK